MIENLRKALLSKYSAKTNNKIANGIMFAGVLINTVEILQNPTSSAVALVFIGAVYQAVIVRCPVCGDKLKGKATKMMDNCPNCNHNLDRIPL